MKKSILLAATLTLYYLNLFILKGMVVNFLLTIILISYPFSSLPALIKAKIKKEKKDEIIVLIIWGLAAIPTGMLILTTILFGLPPEGYGPMDLFK